MVINSEDEIYIGCSLLDWNYGGVRVSKDNGQTWEDMDTGMGRQDIEKLALGSDEHLYALAVNSETPLFKTVQSTITSQLEVLEDKSALTYNYPNPFTGKTTIQFNLTTKEAVHVEIKIFDRLGKMVKLLDVQSAKTGINTVGLDMHDLPSGMYYYSLFVNDRQTDSKKMVVVR
jgi:hypothetical protein